jgi:hypothetical protein
MWNTTHANAEWSNGGCFMTSARASGNRAQLQEGDNFMEGRLKLPLEVAIERDIEALKNWEAIEKRLTRERDEAREKNRLWMLDYRKLEAERDALKRIIAKARLDFESINEKAGKLAESLQTLKRML